VRKPHWNSKNVGVLLALAGVNRQNPSEFCTLAVAQVGAPLAQCNAAMTVEQDALVVRKAVLRNRDGTVR
jgi:hypothetical protein